MPRTRSASARAAGREKRHQELEQQPNRQEAKKPVISPTLSGELGASVPPTKTNDIISNNSNNSNIVARAATPASTRGRLSFGPVPEERYSMGSGLLSFSSDELSPSPPNGRSSSLDSASRQRQQGGTAADESRTNNGSDSPSCVMIDVDGNDPETNDNHTKFEHDLLNSSVASIDIELAGLLQVDGASLSLPPLGEIFSPDRKQQQQQHRRQQQLQQQQQHDISPVPLIRGGSSTNPDTAVFDFDVDEVDAMIGELAEEHDQEHKQHLTVEQDEQRQNLQKLQEEERQQQQQQQDQQNDEQQKQQDQQEEAEKKVDVVVAMGGKEADVEEGRQEQRRPAAATAATAAAGGKEEGVEEGRQAQASPTVATSVVTPEMAVLMDGAVFDGAIAMTQRMEAITKDAISHACAVAVQNQVNVQQAWQKVASTMHATALSLKADNDKLAATNIELESEKRGMAAQINGLNDRVSALIAERDLLAAKLREPGAGSPAETRDNGSGNGNSNSNSNSNRNNKGCTNHGCLSLEDGRLGVTPATPVSETTISSRASAVAAATDAPVAAFTTPASSLAFDSGTATGQSSSTMNTVVAMDVVAATTTVTMATQQCETGLLAKTAPTSVSPSAVDAIATKASTAESAPLTMQHDKPQPAKISTPVAVAPTVTATATTFQPENVTEKPKCRGGKVEKFVIEGRVPWVGVEVGSAVTPSPSAVGNKAQAMLTRAASSTERRSSLARHAPSVGGRFGGAVFPSPPAVGDQAPAMSPPPAASSAERRSRELRRAPWVGGGVGGAVFPSPSAVGNKAPAMSPPPAASSAERRSSEARRAPWVGGGVGGAVFPSPPALGNRAQAMSPLPACSAERRSSAVRRAAPATRSPLSPVNTNTTRRAVPSAAAKVKKATAPCVAKPGRASFTRGTESTKAAAAARATAKVPVKRIVSDDRGAGANRPKPEGMYGRLRSASRSRKNDTTVVAGGGQKVVSGPGVSSRSRQEAATNKGVAERRAKVVPKKRWV